jgi:hypothetical protein
LVEGDGGDDVDDADIDLFGHGCCPLNSCRVRFAPL